MLRKAKNERTAAVMVNKTPLRLIAIGERPDDERDDSAAPVDMMSDADAITRRVPDCEQIAAHETMRDKTPGAGVMPKGAQAPAVPRFTAARKRVLLLAVGAAAISATATGLWLGRGKPVATKASGGDTAARTSVPAETSKPVLVPSLAPVEPAPSKATTKAEIIRLEISAEPVETVLSLDGNMLAGHRLNLQVPRDHGVHVVSASAPGYVPFNQQVSFTSDVVLSISLRRSHGTTSRPVATRTRSSRSDGKHTEARPAVEQPVRQFAPGMHLEGPPARAGARQIDERNPYNP
jgi:hypothetical protein